MSTFELVTVGQYAYSCESDHRFLRDADQDSYEADQAESERSDAGFSIVQELIGKVKKIVQIRRAAEADFQIRGRGCRGKGAASLFPPAQQ